MTTKMMTTKGGLSIFVKHISRSLHSSSLQRFHSHTVSSVHTFRRQLHDKKEAPPSPVFQVWGANTDVGKTALCASLLSVMHSPCLYVKPIQSGFPDDDDSSVVKAAAPSARPITLFSYRDPVSPDLAVKLSGQSPVSDDTIIHSLTQTLHTFQYGPSSHDAIALVETAGGVLSPCPSGNVQADTYRKLRLPCILVGDRRLGGVSSTLSAYEALRLRGYDVPVIVFFAEETGLLDNETSVERNIDNVATRVFQAPSLPPREISLREYTGDGSEARKFFTQLATHLQNAELERHEKLQNMAEEARKVFWYPFTQHAQLDDIDVLCFDSAHGDRIATYDTDAQITKSFVDAMGSWWTNGVGHGNVPVTKAIAHAAGRYGHVMFAEAANEPALELAEKMVQGPGKGWASRVFYSDDGSTAMEVGLKMAFRKRQREVSHRKHLPYIVVALTDSYHGDTLGAMDCSEESDFNKSQTPWYQSRGLFLEPATVALRDGVWTISKPTWLSHDNDNVSRTEHEIQVLGSRRDVFDVMGRSKDEDRYASIIGKCLDTILNEGKVDFGALVMEPVLQGAGGMRVIDPAFQRALVRICKERQIPVLLDEVFTGLWRLGTISAAQGYLDIKPDIAAYGKLITGGTVPLSVTLASEDVLRAFDGDSKLDALLHGHSYTAHPIGCAAGVESLRLYDEAFGHVQTEKDGKVYWDEGTAREISTFGNVDRVISIGTVLAVELKNESEGGGYGATGSKEVVKRLREHDVFARPLGNVVYLMCTPLSPTTVCEELMAKLMRVLEDMLEDDDAEERE